MYFLWKGKPFRQVVLVYSKKQNACRKRRIWTNLERFRFHRLRGTRLWLHHDQMPLTQLNSVGTPKNYTRECSWEDNKFAFIYKLRGNRKRSARQICRKQRNQTDQEGTTNVQQIRIEAWRCYPRYDPKPKKQQEVLRWIRSRQKRVTQWWQQKPANTWDSSKFIQIISDR